jgi:hypothetical protein
VDYKRFGGEPTVTVDRYPFLPGQFGATTTEFRDIAYQSAPQGLLFPHYSQFWKSDDLGQSFRKPAQFPIHGLPVASGGGGGDSYQVVGHRTHKVYYVDLPLHCVTMNVSNDLGETFVPDKLGCGLNPGLDDRQWVEEDESFGPNPCPAGTIPPANCGNVYVTFINFLNVALPTLSLVRSQQGAAVGTFATDSLCNTLTNTTPPAGASDSTPTACPDPSDPHLWVAGPPVADKSPASPHQHDIYIPFIRRISQGGLGLDCPCPWQIYIAKSDDGGDLWTRHKVADIAAGANPANIFPQLTIDRAGNLYYNWSQDNFPLDDPDEMGEQDVYYTFSQGGGLAGTWASPINLTKSKNDSAIFPWMIAGDKGRVDVVYYKSNSGLNSNIAFFEPSTGQECDPDSDPNCQENQAVWNVFFGQSMNALNTGANFSNVQVSAQPNHIGQICTAGLACEGDRDLLDFFTVDVDHLGAAHIAYSDDNRRRDTDTRDRMTRQISGNSIFKDQNINLMSSWPIRDHAVTDRAGDVYDAASLPKGSCPGMDLLKMTADRKDDQITVTLTLNGAPTAAKAIACGVEASSGGFWGVEFWAASDPDAPPPANTGPANEFYIAYRDDLVNGQRVEGGTVDNVNALVTSLEFTQRTTGSLGGDCLPTVGPPATGTCTIAMTVSASDLGISPGNALLNMTGLSVYWFGEDTRIPATRAILGNSEQADATVAFHYLGSGTP